MINITTALRVGSELDATLVDGGAYTESTDEAFHVIREGGVAVLPIDADWEPMARSVLTRCGSPSEHTEQLLRSLGKSPGGDVLDGLNAL